MHWLRWIYGPSSPVGLLPLFSLPLKQHGLLLEAKLSKPGGCSVLEAPFVLTVISSEELRDKNLLQCVKPFCRSVRRPHAPAGEICSACRGNLLSLHPEGCFVLLLFPEASSSSCSDSCAATRALLNICTVSATELWQMWVMITSEAHQKRKHMRLWHYSAGSNLCLIIYWPKKFNKKYVLCTKVNEINNPLQSTALIASRLF